MSEYHGQQHVEGNLPKGVPDIPADHAGKFRALYACPGGTGSYAQARLIGRYGLACGQMQTLDFYDVTLAQARQHRWDYFGLCGAQMTCYDSDHNVVHEE